MPHYEYLVAKEFKIKLNLKVDGHRELPLEHSPSFDNVGNVQESDIESSIATLLDNLAKDAALDAKQQENCRLTHHITRREWQF